uniref:Serine/threonine-protein kinase Nek4 n=1 Tax=Mastacembelus armatus TaxID=205130 RepID=A0A3Q3LFS4_9TELE
MNNYIFIRVVGKGSYGEVNLVKHRTDRKQYVIKKLNLTTSSKRERRAAEQEAQLLSQLRHPNIVTYRESWEGEDCQLYIVMGYCEGGDLYHRLKQQKGELLPERQVVEWFVQIAMALQYLHERNILHRDLKTQNIFLTKTNIIKVGDLGIARVLENQNDMASTLIGTPYYMSPELFSNKPYNHKSDVWALGCCVYEMSTLKHAFNAKDMNSLVYRIVEGKLPQMPSRYDPQLGDLIKSMLCKRPEDRPDVKLILRQPYIKRQIAMFLEATKEKTAKSRNKAVSGSGDCRANNVSSVAPPQPKPERQTPSHQPEPLVRQHKVQNGVTDCTPAQTSPPPKASSPDALKDSLVSLATVSNINIKIQQQEDEDLVNRQVQRPQSVVPPHRAGSEHVTKSVYKDSKGRGKPDTSPVKSPLKSVSGVSSRGGDEWKASSGLLDIQPQAMPNPGDTFSACEEKKMSDVDNMDNTMELLKEAQMQNPKLEVEKEAAFSMPHGRSSHNFSTGNIGVAVEMNMDNRNDTIALLKGASTGYVLSGCCDNKITISLKQKSMSQQWGYVLLQQDKLLERRSDEDECSSSTSSTERSEGDCREKKTESSDMQDLVHMMTQTLRMDVGDSVSEMNKDRLGSTGLPEFKLNRKYRDTLVLHGKAREEAENLSLGEIPIGSTSGPAKIRRAIEYLRTDVVKGLGVKLLDKVLEIMEEEDDTKRELCLRNQMGDEKYQAYAVMVRQLKFFEDIAFKF